MTPLMRQAYRNIDEPTFTRVVNEHYQDPTLRGMMASLFNLNKWVHLQRIQGLSKPSPADMPDVAPAFYLQHMDPILYYHYRHLDENAFNARMASLKGRSGISEDLSAKFERLFQVRTKLYTRVFGEIDHAIDGHSRPASAFPATSSESTDSSRPAGASSGEEVTQRSTRNGRFVYLGGRLNQVRNGRITKTVGHRPKDPQEPAPELSSSSSLV